jgi:hypothetical protein
MRTLFLNCGERVIVHRRTLLVKRQEFMVEGQFEIQQALRNA